jgi:hypothetical protein
VWAQVFSFWTGWAFLASAILLLVGHAPPPPGYPAGAVHPLPLYTVLDATAISIVCTTARRSASVDCAATVGD